MTENLKSLKERYPLIFKRHKRTDLEPIYEVEIYITQESKQKKEVTAREVFLGIKKYPKRIIDNAVKWLYESGLIRRRKIGSGFFFCEEKKDGSFGNQYHTREEIEEIKKEKGKEVIDFIKKNPSFLQKEILENYTKLVSSLNKNDLNMNSYNNIVEFLWRKGFSKFVKLNFKSTAYRYRK
jgi:hypothetical protein